MRVGYRDRMIAAPGTCRNAQIPVQCRQRWFVSSRIGLLTATLAVAQRVRGLVVRQFITRNRRLAAVLALVIVVIGVAAVHVSESGSRRA